MAYHKGDIYLDECGYDARENDGYDKTYRFAGKEVIQLPHSCDSWIIGGAAEAWQMIKDLQEAVKKLEVAPEENQNETSPKSTHPIDP